MLRGAPSKYLTDLAEERACELDFLGTLLWPPGEGFVEPALAVLVPVLKIVPELVGAQENDATLQYTKHVKFDNSRHMP